MYDDLLPGIFRDMGHHFDGPHNRRGPKIIYMQRSGDTHDRRSTVFNTVFLGRVRARGAYAMAVDNSRNDSAVQYILWASAMVFLRGKRARRLFAIPMALDLQPLRVFWSAAEAVVPHNIILDRFFLHADSFAKRYLLSRVVLGALSPPSIPKTKSMKPFIKAR